MIKNQIISDLKKALEKLGISGVEPALEHPAVESHGDYATNVAMIAYQRHLRGVHPRLRRGPQPAIQRASHLGGEETPQELAQLIIAAFPRNDYLEKIEVAGPGFLNFWLKTEFLLKETGEVLKKGDDYGKTLYYCHSTLVPERGRKRIMVEFAHPNTHKMFHIGHLRNISTGESIVRILEANGAEVIRANYQGDVGLHIAKCLWAIKKNDIEKLKKKDTSLDEKIKFLGESYAQGSKAYEEDEAAKKEIGQINKEIYQKTSKISELWQETRAWSLDYFARIYRRVDSHFDRYYFESEVYEVGKKNVLQGLEKGIFEKSERAVIFPGEKFGLHNRVFITGEGNATYEGKDMGLGPLQFSEYRPDLIIHVVGPEQKGYFEVVFKALEQLFPETKGKEFHLVYGWVRLKKGKMSSRTGQVVLAEWLLDEVKKRLQETYRMKEEIAESVAVAAVKYSLLKVSTRQEIAFDINESINLEGDSGPYLQYTYARCMSVLAKASQGKTSGGIGEPTPKHLGGVMASQAQPATPEVGIAPEELTLLRTLYKFPEVVEESGKNYAPNLICTFLFDLAQKYNLFYNEHSILKPVVSDPGSSYGRNDPGLSSAEKSVEEIRQFRLALTAATAQIIKNGLDLLGIKVVNKM